MSLMIAQTLYLRRFITISGQFSIKPDLESFELMNIVPLLNI